MAAQSPTQLPPSPTCPFPNQTTPSHTCHPPILLPMGPPSARKDKNLRSPRPQRPAPTPTWLRPPPANEHRLSRHVNPGSGSVSPPHPGSAGLLNPARVAMTSREGGTGRKRGQHFLVCLRAEPSLRAAETKPPCWLPAAPSARRESCPVDHVGYDTAIDQSVTSLACGVVHVLEMRRG